MPDAKLGLYTHLLPTAHKTIRLEGGFDRVVALHLNQLTSLHTGASMTPVCRSHFRSILHPLCIY
jgi:hypothetical protein